MVTSGHKTVATFTIDNFDYGDFEGRRTAAWRYDHLRPAGLRGTTPTVSIGRAGNDTFVFHPGEGAQTVNNFNAQQDTIELDHFANMQNAEQLAQLVTRTRTAMRCWNLAMATASPSRA